MRARYFLFLICVCSITAVSQTFELELNLQRAHIAKVILGCQEGATRGFDRKVDIFAPPPGMQTGYAGLRSINSSLPLLYKDIRGLEVPQEWQLYCQPDGNQSITVTWDAAQIPEGFTLTVKHEKRDYDMRKVKRVEVRNKTTLIIELKKEDAQKAP